MKFIIVIIIIIIKRERERERCTYPGWDSCLQSSMFQQLYNYSRSSMFPQIVVYRSVGTELSEFGWSNMESNDSPEIPDRRETSDIPGLYSGD